jgi:hypothetical protein
MLDGRAGDESRFLVGGDSRRAWLRPLPGEFNPNE